MLPIYPFMAVLIAQYLEALMQKGRKCSKYRLISLPRSVCYSPWCFCCTLSDDTGQHMGQRTSCCRKHSVYASFGKHVLFYFQMADYSIAGSGCHLYIKAGYQKSSTGSLLYGIIGCVLCLFVALDGVYQPTILAVKSDKHLAEDIRKQVPEGVVYSYTDRMIRFYCTNYYMNNQMRNFTLENPQEGYVILSANAQEEFLKNYNAKYQLEEVFHTDYRSCDLRNTVIMYKFNEKRK